MTQGRVATIQESFAVVTDPRHQNRWHMLVDILMISTCAAICGADTWVEEFQRGFSD